MPRNRRKDWAFCGVEKEFMASTLHATGAIPLFETICPKKRRRRRRLKGIHSRPDTNRTGTEGLSFYYPRLLHCLDQMLAVMSLSQHRVSSSKTVRPRAQTVFYFFIFISIFILAGKRRRRYT